MLPVDGGHLLGYRRYGSICKAAAEAGMPVDIQASGAWTPVGNEPKGVLSGSNPEAVTEGPTPLCGSGMVIPMFTAGPAADDAPMCGKCHPPVQHLRNCGGGSVS